MINTQGVQEVRLKDVLHPQYLRNVELLSSPLPCVCQVIEIGKVLVPRCLILEPFRELKISGIGNLACLCDYYMVLLVGTQPPM